MTKKEIGIIDPLVKPRLLVLSDIGNEPDDQQSLVRLVTYLNVLDLEGLIPTTSMWLPRKINPHLMERVIKAYGGTPRDNLMKHTDDYFLTEEELLSLIKHALPKYGMAGVGAGQDSDGSEWIIHVVDKPDPRPIWITLWGGANCLAQALWKVRETRSQEELDEFIRKIRVYSHVDQDNSAPWIRKEFPNLVSYSRFAFLMKNLFFPLFAYLLTRKGALTGIAFIDATSLAVCHNKRIRRNKIFKGFAKRGKTTSGWFYGFKLHLIINDRGEILAFQLTPGNVADVSVAESLSKGIFGKLFGDKGYISIELAERLLKRGLRLFTSIKSNMKQKLMTMKDKILLRKRALIESVNDQLKNICQIEHTRHRSIGNFLVNVLAGLIAYSHQPKKPALRLEQNECNSLSVN